MLPLPAGAPVVNLLRSGKAIEHTFGACGLLPDRDSAGTSLGDSSELQRRVGPEMRAGTPADDPDTWSELLGAGLTPMAEEGATAGASPTIPALPCPITGSNSWCERNPGAAEDDVLLLGAGEGSGGGLGGGPGRPEEGRGVVEGVGSGGRGMRSRGVDACGGAEELGVLPRREVDPEEEGTLGLGAGPWGGCGGAFGVGSRAEVDGVGGVSEVDRRTTVPSGMRLEASCRSWRVC